MTKIIMHGVLGRMGQAICRIIAQNPDTGICGAVDRAGNDAVGKSLKEAFGIPSDVIISDNLESVSDGADCIIDFSHRDGTAACLDIAAKNNIALVIGTTALEKGHIDQIKKASQTIPIVFSPNMSIGVNILFALARMVSEKLPEGYDIEITEAHHRHKKDAPSGTAMKLAEIIADAKNLDLAKVIRHGRSGDALREAQEIGMHAIRAGSIVGDHTVLYANDAERIEITHKASSRDAFALGAVAAARFAAAKKKGLFNMQDVLNI